MKTLSLLKAVLSQDMNFFRFSTKNNDSKIKKIIDTKNRLMYYALNKQVGGFPDHEQRKHSYLCDLDFCCADGEFIPDYRKC